jgi:hypothetical protein
VGALDAAISVTLAERGHLAVPRESPAVSSEDRIQLEAILSAHLP